MHVCNDASKYDVSLVRTVSSSMCRHGTQPCAGQQALEHAGHMGSKPLHNKAAGVKHQSEHWHDVKEQQSVMSGSPCSGTHIAARASSMIM